MTLGQRLWHLMYESGKRFGVQLRTARATANWTQQRLADEAGMTITAVSMLECDRREPQLDTVLRLCRALDRHIEPVKTYNMNVRSPDFGKESTPPSSQEQ